MLLLGGRAERVRRRKRRGVPRQLVAVLQNGVPCITLHHASLATHAAAPAPAAHSACGAAALWAAKLQLVSTAATRG